MRIAHFLSSISASVVLLLGLVAMQTAWAQSAGTATTAVATNATGKEPVTIRIEDGGATIDETRLGGETQSIQVRPKGGMPRYEVLPAKGDAGGGTRVWKILGF